MRQMRDTQFSGCLGLTVPGSNLHQHLPAALCELRCLRQRLYLQWRAKQPEENLLLLSTKTGAACRGEPDRHKDNMAEQTEGCDLLAACARNAHLSHSNL